MVNFHFDKREDSEYAKRYFWARTPIVCIGFLGFLGPLMLLGRAGDVPASEEMWYDVPKSENPYVCEKENDGGCGTWKMSFDGTKCYMVVTIYRDFSVAQADCEERDANLAMPKSHEENSDISELCGSHSPCWIGLAKSSGGVWAWRDGVTLSWSNWAEGEPNDVDGEEDWAVIGYSRLRDAYALALFMGAIFGFLYACLNVGVVLGICVCVYMALTGNKNDSLVMVAAIADAYCGFWLCIGMVGTAMQLGQGGITDVISIALGLIELVLLCVLAFCGFQLRGKIQQEKQVAPVQVGQVVGQPVMGSTVVSAK
mmetsp:Transcript_143408/g.357308  ORF Transcript_143408/g.357308 Transcript_143408/m.357308 type:complete len:313 (+) Transcript_143408:98-1036(+)